MCINNAWYKYGRRASILDPPYYWMTPKTIVLISVPIVTSKLVNSVYYRITDSYKKKSVIANRLRNKDTYKENDRKQSNHY